MKKIILLVAILALVFHSAGTFLKNSLQEVEVEPVAEETERISIVATIFPAYDIAKNIVKEKGDVYMLIPPGADAHHYEFTPSDITAMTDADLIFIVSPDLDGAWMDLTEKTDGYYIELGNTRKKVTILGDFPHSFNPHIWINFPYWAKMVNTASSAIYDITASSELRDNADKLKEEIYALHYEFEDMIGRCEYNDLFFAGHDVFSYWDKYYGLNVVSIKGASPDSESSVQNVVQFSSKVGGSKVEYLFYDPMEDNKTAYTVASETKKRLMPLFPCGTVSKEDFNTLTMVDIMKINIKNLEKALECQLSE